MKTLFIICIFFAHSVSNCNAQSSINDLKYDSTKLYVEYAYYSGYINDSSYNIVRDAALLLGKEGYLSTIQIETKESYLNKVEQSVKSEKYKEFVMEKMKDDPDLEKKLTIVYAKYYHQPVYYTFKSAAGNDYWVSDSFDFQWKPVNEFKVIEKFKCQKAVGYHDGNEIIAWFTEQIPISAGPAYLSGLPGLILEYENPAHQVKYMAFLITSTEIPDQQFKNWLSGKVISKSQYKKIAAENLKHFEQLQKMIEKGKVNN